MKLIERLLLALVGLLIITLITVFFMAPEVLSNILEGLRNVNIILRLGVVLVLDILILAFVYSRLRSPATTVDGLVVKAPGAITDIGIESARARILTGVQQVPNVIAADVKLEAVRGKALVELNVTVRDANVNVPRKHQEISQALKQVINKQLGLTMLGQPRVHIHLDDERVVVPAKPVITEKPKEESIVMSSRTSNGFPLVKDSSTVVAKDDAPIVVKDNPPTVVKEDPLPVVKDNPPLVVNDQNDKWLESFGKSDDEEKKNGDSVKP